MEALEYYGEVKYTSALFVASALGSVAAAWGIWRDESWGWELGAVVAGSAFLGDILSRTVGLPGCRENSWDKALEPVGVLSLLVEGLFAIVAANVLADRPSVLPTSRVRRSA